MESTDETPDLTAMARRIKARAAGSEPLELAREDFVALALAIRHGDTLRDQAVAILHHVELTSPDAIPCLGLLLAHPNEHVRQLAARGLRHFGVAVSGRRR